MKVHNDYIGPAIKEAIERANADLKAPPSVVLHAIFVAAFNACTEAEPDERKAYASLQGNSGFDPRFALHTIQSARPLITRY